MSNFTMVAFAERIEEIMKNLMLVIKVTHSCNLSCTYCYDKKQQINNQHISPYMLESVIKWSVEYAKNCCIDKITYVWHGGEPLLAGEHFFIQVCNLQKKYLKLLKFSNGIQTNGTLITEELAVFFKQNKFKISISLDGDKKITDISRCYKNNIGAYNDIMKSINILRNYNMNFGISTVIHEGNVEHLIEIYDYFKAQNMNFDFVPSFSAELNQEYLEQFAISIVKLFKHWYFDEDCLSIGFFNDLLRSIVTETIHHCNFNRYCCNGENILVVDINGDLYPCSTLMFNEEYNFGNILQIKNREAIEGSRVYKKILEMNSISEKECNDCDVNKYCNSGCFVRSLRGIPKDFYCKGWYNLINYALDILEKDEIIKKRSEFDEKVGTNGIKRAT